MSIGRLIVEFEARTGKFETDTGRASKIMEKRAREIEAQAKKIGTAIGLGLATAATGLVAFIDRQANSIARLQDLAEQAGDTAEAFGSLSKASAVSGVSLDTVAAASVKLTASLSKMGEDGGPAADAIKALGLNFEQFAKLSPVSQIEAVANALAKFEDGAAKTAVAVALFGRSGAELLPFLNDLADGAERQIALTEEQIQAANAYTEQVGALKGELNLLAQTTAASLIPQLSAMLKKVDDAIKYFARFGEESTFLAKVLRGVEIVFETLTVLAANVAFVFKATGREIGAIAAQMVALAKLDFSGFRAIGDAVKEDAARARAELDDFERRILGTRTAIPGATQAESRPVLKFTPKADEATDKAASSSKVRAQAAQTEADAILELSKALAAEQDARDKLNLEAAEANQDRLNDAMEEGRRIYEATRTPSEAYASAIQSLLTLLDQGAISQDTFNRAVESSKGQFEQSAKAAKETSDSLSAFADQAARNMQDAFADFLFDPFDEGLKGMVRSFAQAIQRMAAEAAAAAIFEKLLGNSGGSSGSSGGGGLLEGLIGTAISAGIGYFSGGMSATGTYSSANIPARAEGGPVMGKSTYLVGERGPELFVPKTAGTIVPNGGFGAAPVVNLRNINAFDPQVIGDYLNSSAGEQTFINLVSRNGSKIKSAIA